MPRRTTSLPPSKVFLVGAGLIIFGLLFAVYGVPLITNAINPPSEPSIVNNTGWKAVTVSGSVVDPQTNTIDPTVGGGVGACEFYNAMGEAVGTSAIDSAGQFSVMLPSGSDYTAYIFFAQGASVTWWWDTFSASIPGYTEESEVDSYQLPNAFTIYPKSTAWGERITFGSFGSATVQYTANAWGGTQTYTAHIEDGFTNKTDCDFFTAIVAGTTYLITIEMTATTPYTALGWSGSIPAHPSYNVEPCMVLWTNRTDWTLVDAGTANAVKKLINGSTTIFIAKLPVVKSSAIATSKTVSFSILCATAGQGQWGANPVFNSSQAHIARISDYKINAPLGYGVVFYGVRLAIGHCG